MDRRHFLSRVAQGLVASTAALRGTKAVAQPPTYRLLSACRRNADPALSGFEAAMLDAQGHVHRETMLVMRAHEIAVHPGKEMYLAVGRQPGRHSSMIELATGRIMYDLDLAADHQFTGHAAFIGAGDELVATEEHIETSVGRLSFYDSASGRYLRSLPSEGIEPHELLIDQAKGCLIIANGGILQRQSVGEVDSSIVVIDLRNGKVLSKTILDEDLRSLSMRHMALTKAGDVAIAMQDQDAQSDLRPLVAVMNRDGKLRFLDIPRDVAMTLRGYVGSVAVDSESRVVCATSPKGSVAMFWSLADDRWLGTVDIADGCGVAPTGIAGGFVVTGGKGDVVEITTCDQRGKLIKPKARPLMQDSRLQWDNHLTLISP